jgi:hypothetical protein
MDNKYPISLYLNQQYVYNILAVMEDGFSTLETIKANHNEQNDKSQKIGGQFSLANMFSFLGVSFNGERETHGQSMNAAESTREKVHTPDSLFAKMRSRLFDQGLVRSIDYPDLEPGAFIEFKVILQKNPLIETLETVLTLLDTADMFTKATNPPAHQNHAPRNNNQRNASGNNQATVAATGVGPQIKILLQSLKPTEAEGNVDLIARVADNPDYKAVLTIDLSFVNDLSLSNLIDGQYTVFAKVTRVITSNDGDKIDLLRKTAWGRVPSLIDKLIEPMRGMQAAGVNVPDLVTELSGPAIQVIPISIFA